MSSRPDPVVVVSGSIGISSTGSSATFTAVNGDGGSTGWAGFVSPAFSYLFNGLSWDRLRVATVFRSISLAAGAGADNAIWTPAASKKFRWMGLILSSSVASRILLKDAAAVFSDIDLPAGGPPTAWPYLGNGILSAAANNVLNLNSSAASTIRGLVFGTEET